MKIKQLSLKNFRGIRDLTFSFDPRMNVIVGDNGAGKSSILDCAAILLSRLTAAISSPKSGGRLYSEEDINNEALATLNEIITEFEGKQYSWSMAKTRPGQPHQESSVLIGVKKIAEIIQGRFQQNKESSIPMAVFYPVNRAVLDIPLRIRQKHEFNQIGAYYGALTGAQNNFRVFFEWYRNREDLENEIYRREREQPLFFSGALPDIQLEAVRRAIPNFLPGFSDLHVQRQPLRMTVQKDGQQLFVNQLSDGEKCTLAIVGDLARRLALANPDMNEPLRAGAIVMIDEIELHLHPKWQRRMVPALEKTFPNCQFILTTHSPQVLSDVRPELVWLLDAKGTQAFHPRGAFGLDSTRILEDLMQDSGRREEVKNAIASLYRKIEEGELQEARKSIEEIRKMTPTEPELTKAAVLIRRKEALGK